LNEEKREFLTATVEYVPAFDQPLADLIFDGYVVARFGPVVGCAPNTELGLVVRPIAMKAVDGGSFGTLNPRRLANMLKAAVDEELAKHRGGTR
jgi:hypothetical protein